MLRNRLVQPLDEALTEIGLDPVKTLGDMHRTNDLIEARVGGNSGGGAPAYIRPARSQITEDLDEVVVDYDTVDLDEGVDLGEAIRIVRSRRLTSGQKAKGRRGRKKRRAQIKATGRKYRARSRRKIAKRARLKLRKYGTAGLERLHKQRKRVVMSNDSDLANLREDLNELGGSVAENSNSYEDAAFNAGLLAMHLGEMFEAYGDTQSAETMFDVSDAASDLSEAFEVLSPDTEELDEDQEDRLQRVLDSLVKGLRIYEAMGSPSMGDIVDFVEGEYGGGGDKKKKGDDDDEDDDDEDEDEEDE